MATLMPNGKQAFVDSDGTPLVGGKLYTYDAGTSTPRPTYTDADALPGSENTNPVILDARGEAVVFWDGAYKVTLTTAADVPIWTVDDIVSTNTLVDDLSALIRADLFDDASATKGAGMVRFGATQAYAARSLGARLTERVSPHDQPWLAATNGITDTTAAVQACLTWAAANNRGVDFTPGRTYVFSSLTVPSGSHLNTGGAIFRADGSVTGNNFLIDVASSSVIDELNVTTPGVTSDRVVNFSDDCLCGVVRVKADSQAGGVENLDGAVQIRGSRTHLGGVYVQNFEVGLVVYGNASTADDVSVEYLQVKSYVRGAYIRNTVRTTIGFVRAMTASANATTSPGHNAVLTAGVEDFCLGGYYVADSGEHGIRIGGTNGAELKTDGVTVGSGTVVRPGQCGIKINPGSNDVAFRHKRITIGNVTTIDCAATSTTGTNEDAFRAENTDFLTVGKITALKDAKAQSCNVGIFLAQCADVSIADYYIDTPLANGVQISEISEGVSGAVGAHSIKGGYTKSAGGNSIVIECGTQAISSIALEGWTSITPTSDAVDVSCASAANCLFKGTSYSPGGKHYDGAISAGIVLDITENGLYRGLGPADSVNAQNRPAGQAWHRDSGFDPASITGEIRGTVVLTSTNGAATGIYTPALVGTLAQSTRRRWAIAGYAGGADADQYGIRFFIYGATTTPSDALTLAGEWDYQGFLLPGADNTRTLGSAALRWSTVYAGTGAINTSDEREKQDIEGIPDTWLDAWADVQYSRFRFRDAVETKGGAARWHCGLVAQRVIDAFRKRGVDPFAAGIVCWDEWGDRFEPVMVNVLDDKGDPTGEQRPTGEQVQVQKAGDRFGVRYEEALVLEAALMRRELARLK